jgi:lipopolysaccharide transport system ATP-binding protein
MSDYIIKVENLSKRYMIGHQNGSGDGFRHAIHDFASAPYRWLRNRGALSNGKGKNPQFAIRNPQPANGNGRITAPSAHADVGPLTSDVRPLVSEDFWALRDVSFEVKQGEVVGIIGRNGAGKSTLLKILSRITEPTEGRVRIRGRVASLLEVGTGFHPELTGRENIFVNGAILGMTRANICRKFDEIVDFAEIEKFLDTPVKRYSSGMYVRLAFAVAAHLEPEILIVDEVLAVGDVQFQRKCLGKMEDVANKDGRTVLFVSHNMDAVTRLCSAAFLIDRGSIAAHGSVTSVVGKFLDASGSLVTAQSASAPAHSPFRLRAARLCNQDGNETSQILWQDGFSVEVEYDVVETANNCTVWTAIRDTLNQEVVCTADVDTNPELRQQRPKGRYRTAVRFPGALLNAGYYTIVVGILKLDPLESYYRTQDITFAIVHETSEGMEEFGARGGAIKMLLDWKLHQV